MLPTLEPGDRLLVVRPRGGHARPPEVGDLVVTADPRQATRLIVKRVAAVDGLTAELVGDNAAASTDSSVFGRVAVSDIQGRAVYRYGPVQRAGWLEPRRRRRRAGTIAGAWPSPE
jgi:nickel-type superoxide dismutase maturation protease